MNISDNARFRTLFLIVIFISISIVQLISINLKTPNNYVVDIYFYYPMHYWIILSILYVIIFTTIIHQSFQGHSDRFFLSLLVFALFISSVALSFQNSSLFFFTGRGDPLSHLGLVKDIIIHESWLSDINMYPMTHLLIASITLISHCPIIQVTQNIPGFLYVVYFLSMYCVGKVLLQKETIFYFFLAFASLPIFGFVQNQFYPYMFMVFFTPFLLYLVVKCKDKQIKEFVFIFLIIILFTSLAHPLYSIIWSILLFFMAAIKYVDFNNKVSGVNPLFFGGLLLLILFLYISFLRIEILTSFLRLYDFAVYGAELNTEIGEQLVRIRPETSITKLIRGIIFYYGHFIIMAIVSGIIFIYTSFSTFVQKRKIDNNVILLSVVSFSLYLLSLILFFVTGFDIHRIYNIGHVFTIVLIPIFILCFLTNKGQVGLKYVLLTTIVIICLVIISLFSIYPSSYFTIRGNEQVTESEYNAMVFFHEHRINIPYVESGARTARFYHAIYGMQAAYDNNMKDYTDRKPKEYLGYDQFLDFADGHGSNIYFLDRFFNQLLELGSMDESILIQFNNDRSVYKFFSNDDIGYYLIIK